MVEVEHEGWQMVGAAYLGRVCRKAYRKREYAWLSSAKAPAKRKRCSVRRNSFSKVWNFAM
jgi:hypothetical protein